MAFKDPGYSPFIQAVVGDGTTAPEVQILEGWFAPSGEKDYVRVYFDPSLASWVDIPRDALLHSEEIAGSYPSGARTIWARADAKLKAQPRPQPQWPQFPQFPQFPSAIDACPSALGCTFACGFDPMQQQQFVGEAPAPTITITGTSPLCQPGTLVGCPKPSTDRQCATLKPALCPSAPNPCPLPTPQPRGFTLPEICGPVPFDAPAPTVTITALRPFCPISLGCQPSVGQPCATLKPALCPSAPNPCPLPTPQPRAFTRFGCPSLPRCF